MAYLDLDEVESFQLPPNRFVSCDAQNYFALTQYKRENYYGPHTEPLSRSIKHLVSTHFPEITVTSIGLLTNLSVCGIYNFNPVSIYYCFNKEEVVVAYVLEVSNTPWLDKRCYVLLPPNSGEDYCSWEKDFHVSPFMDMAHTYHWRFNQAPPSSSSGVEISAISRIMNKGDILPVSGSLARTRVCDMNTAEPVSFVVKLSLKRRVELDQAWKTVLRNPIMPLVAVLWIHVEAFRVWARGVSYKSPPKENVGGEPLGVAHLLKHLVLFVVAASVRYGVPVVLGYQVLMRSFNMFVNWRVLLK